MTKINKQKKHKGPKNRKQLRKDKRKEKKQQKHLNYVNRNKHVLYPETHNNETTQKPLKNTKVSFQDTRAKELKKDKDVQKKLQKDMAKQRKKLLMQANLDEDRNIKHLEKQLNLNKRKAKSVPKSFANDGLDFLLEMCEPENRESAAAAEKQFDDLNNEFEDDFALVTGTERKKSNQITKIKQADEDSLNESDALDESNESYAHEVDNNDEDMDSNDLDEEFDEVLDEEDNYHSDDDENLVDNSDTENFGNSSDVEKKKVRNNQSCSIKRKCIDIKLSEDSYEDSDVSNDELDTKKKRAKRNKQKTKNTDEIKSAKDSNLCDKNINNDMEIDEENINDFSDKEDTWEDIYGRIRSKDGSVVQTTSDKYVPPALRKFEENNSDLDKTRKEKLSRLRKQLKGSLNRLAESNMHSIATQIEKMYMANSRHDMNETLIQLIFDALISPVLTPERLLLEHILLIAILHANVGTEVGAQFLQSIIEKFNDLYKNDKIIENKELDNIVHVIAQLYNFKIFHSRLLYQVLEKLSEKFGEKHVECLLLVLKNVGFTLRKDDPNALKELILNLQKKAVTISDDNSRVKYMLDILLAIKNNNVTKIPNYDTTYSEHLKIVLKSFIRKGNYVTQLNISLEDLLNVEERGRWWIVGSAWTGTNNPKPEKEATTDSTYNQKLLDLARKQRMNTDTRRSVFCALMTAENYTDAFEKLLNLGLKNQQEREIINVLLHCALREKKYNLYYGLLAQKFCEYDRKYQMIFRCSFWDKLKTLTECSTKQISILARLLTHLFLNQGLPISVLKVIQFSELDQITLRLIRQVLLGILLYTDEEMCLAVFQKVALSPKLKMFRESLRLFIHHFLLRNLNTSDLSDDNKEMLNVRAKLIEKSLSVSENKIRF